MLRPSRILAALLAFAWTFAAAQEVQQPGLVFEEWVRAPFFEGYRPPNDPRKWDIPAAGNTRFGGVPVIPKAIKYGAPGELDDALRQYRIDEPCILVVGFWRQEGEAKHFVNIVPPPDRSPRRAEARGPVTLPDRQRLDSVITDKSPTPEAARAAALKFKMPRPSRSRSSS